MSATHEPMRILIISPWEPWPLDHGGRLRLHHVMSELSRGNKLTLAMPSAPLHGPQVTPIADVAVMCGPNAAPHPAKRLATRMAGRHFGRDDRIASWLDQNATPSRFDVALCCGPHLGQYIEYAHVPVVWDVADDLVLYTQRAARYAGVRRWPLAARNVLLYGLYQRSVARRAAATVFVSSVDARSAARWTGSARIETVTAGVDLEYFRGNGCAPEPGTVVFVGALDFPPNVDAVTHFAEKTWPAIHAADDKRRLSVVGRRPTAAVRALSSLPGVRVIGDVEDVRPYLARAAAVVAPTRLGGGVKNKILEGCSMRRPVVASERALGGLTARPGVDVLMAGCKAEWILAVSRILEDPAFARRIAESGHDWVSREHRWADVAARMGTILRSVRLKGRHPVGKREAACR